MNSAFSFVVLNTFKIFVQIAQHISLLVSNTRRKIQLYSNVTGYKKIHAVTFVQITLFLICCFRHQHYLTQSWLPTSPSCGMRCGYTKLNLACIHSLNINVEFPGSLDRSQNTVQQLLQVRQQIMLYIILGLRSTFRASNYSKNSLGEGAPQIP